MTGVPFSLSEVDVFDLSKGIRTVIPPAPARIPPVLWQEGRGFDLPIFTSELPHHGLLTPFRRLGQRAMYHWYYLKDEML